MIKEERYQKAADGLGQAIFQLSWLGEWWGFFGVLILDKIRAYYLLNKLGGDKKEILSSRSSSFYAAAGNAKANGWWFLSACCLWRAMRFSNQLVKLAGGIKNMTPAQLDVRSHILRKVGRHKGAFECVNEALRRDNVTDDSRVLLLMGKAESLAKLGEMLSSVRDVYREAFELQSQVLISVGTRVRLLRSYASSMFSIGNKISSRDYLLRAKKLAIEEGLNDQVEKIDALLAKI